MAKVKVIVEGVEYDVEVEELPGGKFRVSFGGDKTYEVEAKGLGIDVSALASVPSAPSFRFKRSSSVSGSRSCPDTSTDGASSYSSCRW